MENIKFPAHVFEDVKGNDFLKHNKKHVTEDFVTENFNLFGWRVYRPFNDTGIDLIATRYVCPNGHTAWNDNSQDMLCKECNQNKIEITRYIQVKTREVKETKNKKVETFGYTLKSKDFRTDPRHVFLLYSDYTNDFIIIPTFDYLKLFYDNKSAGSTHFATPSFRQGNNKLNSLKYNKENKSWCWNPKKDNIPFNKFVNHNGMQLITSPNVDLNLSEYLKSVQDLKFKLFYNFSKGKSKYISSTIENQINEHFNTFINKSIDEINSLREKNRLYLKNSLSEELLASIQNGYFVKFKGVSFYE